MDNSIVVKNLGKKFRKYNQARPHTLQEAIVRGFKGMRASESFWALKNVSFSIREGNMVGVIGHNGAGKSTLLRLVGDLGKPDEGSIKTNGRIGALLSLGAGFHPELTGRENIYINGVISGLLRKQVHKQFDSIVEFAELEEFIDNPLHTYSSGMAMRLGFSIATHIQPDILLIDEVLAVGDLAFQQKCLDRIIDFKRKHCTILLVSHDTHFVAQHCDSAVWLDKGQIRNLGPAAEVVDQYVEAMQEKVAVYKNGSSQNKAKSNSQIAVAEYDEQSDKNSHNSENTLNDENDLKTNSDSIETGSATQAAEKLVEEAFADGEASLDDKATAPEDNELPKTSDTVEDNE